MEDLMLNSLVIKDKNVLSNAVSQSPSGGPVPKSAIQATY